MCSGMQRSVSQCPMRMLCTTHRRFLRYGLTAFEKPRPAAARVVPPEHVADGGEDVWVHGARTQVDSTEVLSTPWLDPKRRPTLGPGTTALRRSDDGADRLAAQGGTQGACRQVAADVPFRCVTARLSGRSRQPFSLSLGTTGALVVGGTDGILAASGSRRMARSGISSSRTRQMESDL